jgi:hypothetical protein
VIEESEEQVKKRLALEKFTADIGRMFGEVLKEKMPGVGFSLLLFEFGGPGKAIAYVSNAQREDMISSMKELLAKWEGDDV